MLHRVWVLVEGLHDEIVIGDLLESEFAQARARVTPVRGGKLLSTSVDSFTLAGFSDAPVVAVLDNLHAQKAQAFWAELREAAEAGANDFDDIVARHFSSKEKAEDNFLIDYCRTVAERGLFDRFHIFGLSERDIPMYLPAESLGMPADWPELLETFDAQSKVKSFKPWLRIKHGIEINPDDLRDAVGNLDEVPQEFVDLADFVTAVSLGHTTQPHGQ